MREKILENLSRYNLKDLSVAVLGSHSALQILKGAKEEGLRTILVVTEKLKPLYEEFSNLVDRFICVREFADVLNLERELLRENAIFVPHGSTVEYVGAERFRELNVPVFGNRDLMVWESSQKRKIMLLREAGIEVPREYSLKDQFEDLVIVKLPGAKGGKYFFVARSREEVLRRLRDYLSKGIVSNLEEVLIQKYIIGVPMYFHYFYSPLFDRVEILGIDIRYETNVDGLRRLPLRDVNVEPTFVVVGNLPVVIREKMLLKVLDYGKRFVRKTKEHIPPGAIGPFCLESIVVDDERIVVFEFSGRIVAGTNIYIGYGSPYGWLYWNEPMYMGKRIAREIKISAEMGHEALVKIVT